MDLASGHLHPEFGELWATFWWRQKFLTADIWHTICQSVMKFGNVHVGGLASRPYSLHFVNFGPAVS